MAKLDLSPKTALLKALRKGDFGALLGLKDLYDAEGNPLGDRIGRYLDYVWWLVHDPKGISSCRQRGAAEKARYNFRWLAHDLNDAEGVWRLPPRTDRHTRGTPVGDWCYEVGRLTLAYVRERPLPPHSGAFQPESDLPGVVV